MLAANKVDDAPAEPAAASLWSLGLGEPVPVSALHGRGSGDLLDAVLDGAARRARRSRSAPTAARAGWRCIGRPNVGKSSLLNKLAGQERVLVDAVAGTTRDPVDELIELGGTHLAVRGHRRDPAAGQAEPGRGLLRRAADRAARWSGPRSRSCWWTPASRWPSRTCGSCRW